LTKQEHIVYWIKTAKEDWKAVQSMYNSKVYIHALFFAHLVLEKLCKAHWVKDNIDNTPPKIHNLITLISKTNFQLPDADKEFMYSMNQFQLEGRYPDYKLDLQKRYKSAQTKKILEQVNNIRKCLLKDLPSVK